MTRNSIATALKFCFVAFLLFVILFEDGIGAASFSFIGFVLRETTTVCRDSAIQWMLAFCLTIYFVIFLILERRAGSDTPRLRFTNQNLWLAALVLLALLQYALAYGTASHSIQLLVLMTGVVIGKAILTWIRREGRATPSTPDSPGEKSGAYEVTRPTLLLVILLALLAASALLQPERSMRLQYHGVSRWSGVWENPNLYGLLMGVGIILAVGLGLRRWGMEDDGWQRVSCVLLCSFAAILCGIGLFKSYSRGAWFAVFCGLGYLIWNNAYLIRPPATFSPSDAEKESKGGEREIFSRISRISRLNQSWLPMAVILISIAVLAFWQFRFSESRPAQRLFSAANANDFSWRNRVTAWGGAVRMMMDRPWTGFGWGQAETEYGKKYCPLNESAAIELNDYLMIGISAGVPALLCFVAYVALCFKVGRVTPCAPPPANEHLLIHQEGAENNARGVRAPHASGDVQAVVSPQTVRATDSPPSPPLINGGEGRGEVVLISSVSGCPLQTICRAGAIVLLVGFWFDGGLFKLPVATVFWMLMELARIEYPVGDEVTRLTSKAGNQSAPPHIGSHPKWEPWLRRIAWIVAPLALIQTTVYLGTPLLSVGDRTLAIARKCLIRPNEAQDLAFLSTNADWHGRQLKILLEHVQLANYNRQLINWQPDDPIYRDFVLSPVITGKAGEDFAWRRPLWEEFYPRIRHETSPEDAAAIVVRHLRERVTIAGPPHPAREVPAIWLQQLTDETGFEIIYVAALRSVGVPARLNAAGQAEFYAGGQWQPALRSAVSL